MPHAESVRSLFAGISGRYDLANHLLSGGVDFYWRARLVRAVRRHRPRCVVDLATGSGDVAFALRKRLPQNCPVTGLDFCEPMLEQARSKQRRRRIQEGLDFDQGDCLDLPLETGSVDALTIAFGLRNLEDRQRGLREMLRVLDPQRGALFVLEFTQPDPWLRPVYRFYLQRILPRLAALATGNKAAYDYLAGSVSSFPDKAALALEMETAGFRSVQAIGLTGSIVALHTARP